ncbi:MAG: prepilin-type N-terminal cleavage/methylation domain-containing protein [Candidatus Omnitrophica bacterium]|nr:prepilin-type N-terminal cleavage/methylation domain-containing protein [Candidatus Omnitrophota bacterium]
MRFFSGQSCRQGTGRRNGGSNAFTLLEVMIATAIFFMAIFAILNLVSQNLRAARALQQTGIDASSLAAELSLTNRLEEGGLPVELADEFVKDNPGYNCDGEITMVSTNGMFQVDLRVWGNSQPPPADPSLSVLLYRPDSITRPGAGAGAGFQPRGRIQ